MKRFSGLDAVRPGALRDPVCAVGMFDGVHRGHRQLLYELTVWAASVKGESCVLTFDRHPLEVLKGVEVPALLPLETRLLELQRHGVDAAVVLSFAAVKDLEPEAFLEDVLRDRLGCRRLLLGFDSHLGKDRKGDAETLPPMGGARGMGERVAGRVLDRGGRPLGPLEPLDPLSPLRTMRQVPSAGRQTARSVNPSPS